VTVTFNASSFVDITHATAEEVAAAIEAQVAGVSARAQDGRLVVSSDSVGAASSLQVTAASSSALFAIGTSDVGSGLAVAVQLSGTPTAGHEGHFTVRALGDGVIGQTPGLEIELLDASGARVGTFDVGDDYVPGEPIELVPGVKLSLTAGSIQQSAGDVFEFDVVGDSDEADALVGLQLGAFFTGSGAADVAVAADVAGDPRLIAGSRNGAPNDGSGFHALLALKDAVIGELSDRTIAAGYGDLVAGIGFDVSSNDSAATSQAQLLSALESRREEISGVNTDEEMLKLIEYQHLYQAAGRYLQSVNEMTAVLFQML
jgi:flagellar hook-associated protein FlgK